MAHRGIGTTLTLVKKGTEGANLVLKRVTSIGAPELEKEEIDITALDSPDQAKEYMSGSVDAGSIEVEIQTKKENEDQLTKLAALFDSGETRSWEIGYPTGAKLALNAFVSKISYGEVNVEDLLKYSITLRVSGKPVYTPSGR